MMAEGDEKDKTMLKSIYGILFFGVPNQGMQNSSLVAMARGQPNEALIQTLGTESEYLRDLHAEFRRVFAFRSSVIFSFYETEESPTAILVCLKSLSFIGWCWC
jgi:protein SERAC1